MDWGECRAGLPEAGLPEDRAWGSWVCSPLRIRMRGIASTTVWLGVCREKRGFSEVHSNRTRGKGCGLERGKFRSGIMKT